jgi:hypothetical protein
VSILTSNFATSLILSPLLWAALTVPQRTSTPTAACCDQPSAPPVLLHAVDEFMTAAREGDTLSMRKWSRNYQPLHWAAEWRNTAPEFFEQTRTLERFSPPEKDRSTAFLTFTLQYKGFAGQCRRTDPADKVYFEFAKDSACWAIQQVWMPIC